MDNTQFKRLLQIGILVEDVEAAARHYQEDYGFGPWRIESLSTAEMDGVSYIDGREGDIGAFIEIFNGRTGPGPLA